MARSSAGTSRSRTKSCFEHADLPGERQGRIAAFVEHDNRAHVSLGNLAPTEVDLGRGSDILRERVRIKRQTLIDRRLRPHAQAA